jgi:hypothetical protein
MKKRIFSVLCCNENTGYRLDYGGIYFQFLAKVKKSFHSLSVQVDCRTHTASYPVGIGGTFPLVKSLWHDACHSVPFNAEAELSTYVPYDFVGCTGTNSPSSLS